MTELSNLRQGYDEFYQKYFIDSPETYQKLAKDGQSPETLVIACSDSRVDPSILFSTGPGDIFVIRNVANLVPPHEHDEQSCHGTSAAIEYAVTVLGVKNIIVLGHQYCGGISTLISDEVNDHNFIDNWLYIAEDAKLKALAQYSDKSQVCACCEKEAIKISIQNLRSFPFIGERLANSSLSLHGWYFCLETGRLEEVI